MPKLPVCPIHGKPGRLVFPCCIGAAGGKSRSRKKLKAVNKTISAVNERRKIAGAE